MAQIEILQAFDESATALSAVDVVSRTGLPRSTVFRTLRSLVDSGFLLRDAASRKYILGPRILQLGMTARQQLSSDEMVADPLLALLHETQETVTFSILDLPWRVCTYVLEAPNDVRHVAQVGARYPLHLGAASKVILAHLDPETVESLIRREGMTDSEASDLLKQLPAMRARGYAVTGGERVPGAAAIAAPVFVAGRIFGAVAVTGPADRVRDLLEDHRPAVIKAAQLITDRLSQRPDARSRPSPHRNRSVDARSVGSST